MILLNAIYGLIMAVGCVLGLWFIVPADLYATIWWRIGLIIWVVWTGVHCIYDPTTYWVVKWFNRNKVYRGR